MTAAATTRDSPRQFTVDLLVLPSVQRWERQCLIFAVFAHLADVLVDLFSVVHWGQWLGRSPRFRPEISFSSPLAQLRARSQRWDGAGNRTDSSALASGFIRV